MSNPPSSSTSGGASESPPHPLQTSSWGQRLKKLTHRHTHHPSNTPSTTNTAASDQTPTQEQPPIHTTGISPDNTDYTQPPSHEHSPNQPKKRLEAYTSTLRGLLTRVQQLKGLSRKQFATITMSVGASIVIAVALVMGVAAQQRYQYIHSRPSNSAWMEKHYPSTAVFEGQKIITPTIPHVPVNADGVQTNLTPQSGTIMVLDPSSPNDGFFTYCTIGAPITIHVDQTVRRQGFTTAGRCFETLGARRDIVYNVFLESDKGNLEKGVTYSRPGEHIRQYEPSDITLWGVGTGGDTGEYLVVNSLMRQNVSRWDTTKPTQAYPGINPTWVPYDYPGGVVFSETPLKDSQRLIAHTWPVSGVVATSQYQHLTEGMPVCVDGGFAGVTCGHIQGVGCGRANYFAPDSVADQYCISPAIQIDIPTSYADAGAAVFMVTDHNTAIILGSVNAPSGTGNYIPDFTNINQDLITLRDWNTDTFGHKNDHAQWSRGAATMVAALEPELARLNSYVTTDLAPSDILTEKNGFSSYITSTKASQQ